MTSYMSVIGWCSCYWWPQTDGHSSHKRHTSSIIKTQTPVLCLNLDLLMGPSHVEQCTALCRLKSKKTFACDCHVTCKTSADFFSLYLLTSEKTELVFNFPDLCAWIFQVTWKWRQYRRECFCCKDLNETAEENWPQMSRSMTAGRIRNISH